MKPYDKNNLCRTVLPGGPTVIALSDKSAPSVFAGVWVKSGSAGDPPGLSGVFHLMEHLFYRGGEKRGKAKLVEEIQSLGGYNSASTWYDWTRYWSVVPPEYLGTAVDGLTDALRSIRCDESLLDEEIPVVREEIRRHLDDSPSALFDELMADVFRNHPYSRRIIGSEDTVDAVRPEDVERVLGSHYTRGNTVAVLAGDVDPDQAVQMMQRGFEGLASGVRSAGKSACAVPETGAGERYITSNRINCQFYSGFPTPPAGSPESTALKVLAEILGGGEASRLHQEMVELQRLSSSISAGLLQMRDAGVFYVGGVPLEYEYLYFMRDSAMRLLSEILDGDLTAGEVDAAKRKLALNYLFKRETPGEKGLALGDAEAVDTAESETDFLDNLGRIERDDVVEAGRRFLGTDQCSCVMLFPEKVKDIVLSRPLLVEHFDDTPAEEDGAQEAVSRYFFQPSSGGTGGAGRKTPAPEKFVTSSGLTVLLDRVPSAPLAAIGLFSRSGQAFEKPGRSGTAQLLVETMFTGTRSMKRKKLQESLNGLGGRLNYASGKDYSSVELTVAPPDFGRALEILSSVLTEPMLEEDEIEKLRHLALARLADRENQLLAFGFDRLREILYSGTPYDRPVRGSADCILAIKKPDIEQFHASFWNTGNIVASISGDADTGETLDFIEKSFACGKPAGRVVFPRIRPAPAAGVHEFFIDKNQSLVIAARPVPPITHEDYGPLCVFRMLLGMRLYGEIIYGRSLAYDAGCAIEALAGGGFVASYAVTSPGNVDAAAECIKCTWDALVDGDFEAGEFDRIKRGVVGSRRVSLERLACRAGESALSALYDAESLSYENLSRRMENTSVESTRALVKRCFDAEPVVVMVVN